MVKFLPRYSITVAIPQAPRLSVARLIRHRSPMSKHLTAIDVFNRYVGVSYESYRYLFVETLGCLNAELPVRLSADVIVKKHTLEVQTTAYENLKLLTYWNHIK